MPKKLIAAAALAAVSACGAPAPAPSPPATPPSPADSGPPVVERALNAERGRTVFVEKGCVICHSVNGVGGKAAPPLDAPIGAPPIDPLDFAARIWQGAPAMVELQSVELGYTIHLTGDDLADLAAFAGDREAQRRLTEAELPETIRDSLLDEQFWEVEGWNEFLREGREGYEPEPPEEDEPIPDAETAPEEDGGP